MLQTRSGQSSSVFPHLGCGVDRGSAGGRGGRGGGEGTGRGQGQMGSNLRQRHGQVGGVHAGHVTSGDMTLTEVNQHQNSHFESSHSRRPLPIHSFTPTPCQNHTPSPNSPPPSPLTSVPRKKHSDNQKPINIAVYSAPLSPHSEQKTPEHKQPSQPSLHMQMYALQNAGGQSAAIRNVSSSHHHMPYVHVQDHTPPTPRQPPNGYDQSATMQQSFQVTPPTLCQPRPQSSVNQPHPHSSANQPQQHLRTGSTGLTSSRPESQGHSPARKLSSGGYGTQAPSNVAMVTHQYTRSSSSSSTSMVVNHSPSQTGSSPMLSKQLSTRSLQGYPSTPNPLPSCRENPMMSSFSSPALPSHAPHPLQGHAQEATNASHTHAPHSSHSHSQVAAPSTTFHPSQGNSQATAPACTQVAASVPLRPPLVSRAELMAGDIEAQPTPEMIMERQPVATGQSLSTPHSMTGTVHCPSSGFTSGSGIASSSGVSHSYSNSQQTHWSGSQSSLIMSHSSSKAPRTSESKVPQIQVDPIPSTLVTSSTRTKPTAAINEGGSSSPLRRKRMGHCRHLSLGNNIPRQRPTHARNRSLGSVNINHILPPSTLSSRQESLGNLSLLSHASSMTGSRISLNSGFLSEAQMPQTPDPENGYDFVQHFNLFSQYTSNMALEYYTARKESSAHLPPTPPVWCMDVWNRIIVVGCGNGQIEVGVALIYWYYVQYRSHSGNYHNVYVHVYMCTTLVGLCYEQKGHC